MGDEPFYLNKGLLWSLPIFAWYFIPWLIPAIRDELVVIYSPSRIMAIANASNGTIFLFAILVVLAAILEEFFYRGVLVKNLQERTNSPTAVFISAVFFACSHFILIEFSVKDFVRYLILGLLFGFAYVSTSSCITSILPHMIQNLTAIGIMWILIS